MKRLLTAVGLSVLALGASAQLSLTGGTGTTITGYDPSGPTAPQTYGLIDPTIIADSVGELTATFLGFEALDSNDFTFDAGAFGALHNSDAVGTSISTITLPGTLDFSFIDHTTSTGVKNGVINPTYASFVVLGSSLDGVFTPYTDGGLYTYVLGFNDGLKVDADYDDMVVGLTLAPVPEPETYALMLAGIGAVGFIARRRRKNAL